MHQFPFQQAEEKESKATRYEVSSSAQWAVFGRSEAPPPYSSPQTGALLSCAPTGRSPAGLSRPRPGQRAPAAIPQPQDIPVPSPPFHVCLFPQRFTEMMQACGATPESEASLPSDSRCREHVRYCELPRVPVAVTARCSGVGAAPV